MRSLIFTMLISVSAFADQSAPKLSANQREVWVGKCAERLERARDELVRSEVRSEEYRPYWWGRRANRPQFAKGVVEAGAEEIAAQGDPSARSAIDVVEYRLVVGRDVYLARLEPNRDHSSASQWSQEGGNGDGNLIHDRSTETLQATIVYPPSTPANGYAPPSFHTFFRRALDDCLQLRKGK